METRQATIEFLLREGFVGAAHQVSLDTYGYGMEDTDDALVLYQLTVDQSSAENYIREHG